VTNPARVAVRHAYDAGLRLTESHWAPRSLDASVVLLGSGRSGTTALMEAFSAGLSGYPIFEPLRPGTHPSLAEAVPSHGYPRLRPGDDDPALEAFVGDVLRGHRLSRWSTCHAQLRDLRGARALVVKEVRANRMAGWLRARFPEVPCRLVVRHPVSVVNSMLEAPYGWSRMEYDELVPAAAEALGWSDVPSPHDSRAAWLALVWAADTRLALDELDEPSLAASVFHEQLRSDPAEGLRTLSAGLPGFDVDAALASYEAPSRTASQTFVATGGKVRRDQLSDADLDAVGAILARAGLGGLYDLERYEPTGTLTRGS
jgi:hypothetical protein